ncbi:chorismate synthase [Bowdeniella nasicola]|uniref:Chorismate synthase n=1 Tax=Bowdeniella nasicola TaxID=208480 RepID=A0A1Q5Q3V1_9ACTO|nr:chorismate synthase [Bowdeniella nasicola]OKL54310.1 chorismate synthase [Bowdeniella nasicola]
MFSWSTAGESHGQALVALAEGVPAGVEVTSAEFAAALARRRLGYGRGARMSFEQDVVQVLAGLVHGRTIGSPVALTIGNSEWPKWTEVMGVDPIDCEPTGARAAALKRPRPGHADFAGMAKYGHTDCRPILERASARETAARVALGTLAEAIIEQIAGIRVVSHVIECGYVALPDDGIRPGPADTPALDETQVRCLDPDTDAAMVAEIDAAKKAGDTLGGIVEVIAYGVPVGLGSHVEADRRLDAALAAALMSIQAIKGVEIGDGFHQARSRGSRAHDEMTPTARLTNLAGGIEGGMSNGSPIVVRAALKPISSVPRALRTFNVDSGEEDVAINQRSDTCAVAPAAVVAQAMVALVLARALLDKTGGDSVAEARRNLASYLDNLPPAIAAVLGHDD